jgi:two-component sensor histidine kinase
MSLHAESLIVPAAPHAVISRLDIAPYLRSVCAVLTKTMGTARHSRVHVEIEPLSLPAATARSLGLLTAELVGNALQHAVPRRQDMQGHDTAPVGVWVTGTHAPDGSYRLSVEDNGVGLPDGCDLQLRPPGRGLRRVAMLVDELRGRLAVDGTAGTRFTLRLIPALIA